MSDAREVKELLRARLTQLVLAASTAKQVSLSKSVLLAKRLESGETSQIQKDIGEAYSIYG
jgi:hypothetical protein